jgi:hypothetical protein
VKVLGEMRGVGRKKERTEEARRFIPRKFSFGDLLLGKRRMSEWPSDLGSMNRYPRIIWESAIVT